MEEREDGGEVRSWCERGMAHLADFEDEGQEPGDSGWEWPLEAGNGPQMTSCQPPCNRREK